MKTDAKLTSYKIGRFQAARGLKELVLDTLHSPVDNERKRGKEIQQTRMKTTNDLNGRQTGKNREEPTVTRLAAKLPGEEHRFRYARKRDKRNWNSSPEF